MYWVWGIYSRGGIIQGNILIKEGWTNLKKAITIHSFYQLTVKLPIIWILLICNSTPNIFWRNALITVFHSEPASALGLLTVRSLWGNPGMARCWRKSDLGFGYIQQLKILLASCSGMCWWVSTVSVGFQIKNRQTKHRRLIFLSPSFKLFLPFLFLLS